MAYNLTKTNSEDGVYSLLTELCTKTASKYCNQNRVSQKLLMTKMRSNAYEIILKKSSKEYCAIKGEPIMDLLTYYFVYQLNVTNIAAYKRSIELRKIIDVLRQMNFDDNKDNIHSIIRFLIGLSNTVKEELSTEMFQNPFSFGLLDEMLPKPKREMFGSPQPYSYFPSYVFELPYSLNKTGPAADSQSYAEYTFQAFDSKSFIQESSHSPMQRQSDMKSFLSPMSLASLTSTHLSPYSQSTLFDFGRLTAPRDLQIPTSNPNVKISLASTTEEEEVKEVFRCKTEDESIDIWELATQIDKDIPNDIWDMVCKMPPIEERQLIASSSREVCLWQATYGNMLNELDVIPEKQFIRHIMYLIIGVETISFPFSHESNSFYMKENLILQCISKEHIRDYVTGLLLVGTYYRRLYKFAFNETLEDHFHNNGLVYEAARQVVRKYLLEFRLNATEIFEKSCKDCNQDLNCMPTLLQILYHIEPLKYQIETVASIYKVIDTGDKTTIPRGAELMSYLFNEISLITHKQTTITVYKSLYTICQVYFKFIERYIFEGELDDRYNEFFIRKDNQYVNLRSKRYWDKGFHITQSVAVPDFLKSLAKFILLCGKSLRLLKLCNPSDPLVLLISSDHPSVKCCASFEELEQQQQVLDVYRTRCLFVSGELVTFDQILLKREAERKAFAEMASLKQAETMEKIVAERKRLAQLIIAEKQHSLRVLEAAMAEAKAAKSRAKQRERKRHELEHSAEKVTEEVDSRLRDVERNKIMEYYSKLNMEVEKSKMHTEWKIKRLQLDQSRMQLLSTEERNLKREKLELEHRKNEEIMAMSIQSINSKSEDAIEETEAENIELEAAISVDKLTDPSQSENAVNNREESEGTIYESASSGCGDKMTESSQSAIMKDIEDIHFNINDNSTKPSTMISAICNVAKNFFGVSKAYTNFDEIENNKELDEQGNFVYRKCEERPPLTTTSSDIGSKLDETYDNVQFKKNKEAALSNKHKVMAHEFGKTDAENNKLTSISPLTPFDEENNFKNDWTSFMEAERNKQKVLGTDINQIPERIPITGIPRTDAQKEALINKQKVLGVEYNLPALPITFREPANEAQESALQNKKRIMTEGYNINEVEGLPKREGASKEAILNKQKVLGVEYNLPAAPIVFREPINEAQEYAVQNRKKIMTAGHDINMTDSPKRDAKRSGLTLNLKPYGEPSTSECSLGVTPNTGTVTPGDIFPRLDLETPTTADIPLDDAMTADIFTPKSEGSKDFESVKQNDKEFLLADGFNFSVIEDENVELAEITSDQQTEDTPDVSPSKSLEMPLITAVKSKNAPFNVFDGSYTLDDFDPFGVKDLINYTEDYFSQKMTLNTNTFCYTLPSVIMEEARKRPYANIFASTFNSQEEEGDEKKITCDNIATLAACLQRSVMIPLTYQLEVVNNSILTYFLVTLDMYEHLRSLKDYFFLMDGEFSKSICHNLFTKLVKTLNPQELLNFATLHNILDKALGSSISHVNKFSENLSFTITESPLSFLHSSPDVLQCLSLTYTVSWPLNIILSQEALIQYAKVFQFLIKMRRIFWVLGEDFEALKLSVKLSKKHSRKLLKSPHYISVQICRHIMASLIRALDNYIVTTCILTSWTEFENDLKKARTLDDLYECHVVYIKKVLFRCLLNNRSTLVMKLLNDIFTVILKFSRVLKAGEWQQQEQNGFFTHTSFNQLQELFHLFEKLAKYLHKVVTKLMERGYQRHLVELLTMVNLNGYYDLDKLKEEQNTSVQSTTRI